MHARPRRESWRSWSMEVSPPKAYDDYRNDATLHTFAELQEAALDAPAALMSERWSRCCKLGAIARQEERYLEATQEIRELQPPPVVGYVPQDEWELRAWVEHDALLAREEEAWEARRARAVADSSPAPDWRVDVRYGPQTAQSLGHKPYRDCTLREIWDFITDRGQNADPRDVEVTVSDPRGVRLDPRTTGAWLQQDAMEMLEEAGRMHSVPHSPPRRMRMPRKGQRRKREEFYYPGPCLPLAGEKQHAQDLSFACCREKAARWRLLAIGLREVGDTVLSILAQMSSLRSLGKNLPHTRVWGSNFAPPRPIKLLFIIGETSDVVSAQPQFSQILAAMPKKR